MASLPAAQVAADIQRWLEDSRPSDNKPWVLPRDHPLTSGIFPFCASKEVSKELLVRPIGTAFSISELGVVCTAHHNVRSASNYSRHEDELLGEWPEEVRLPDIGLCVIQRVRIGEKKIAMAVPHLHAGVSSRETDVVIAHLHPRTQPLSGMNLPLSLSVPRVGEKLMCVGYANMTVRKVSKGHFSTKELAAGTFSLDRDAEIQLKVTEGKVTRVLTQGIGRGFPTGPCVLLDCEVDHGQSGGPVFNEEGFVCGFVGSSGFLPKASVVALLYPTYMLEIEFAPTPGSSAPPSTATLRDLIQAGKVSTDGNEGRVWVEEADGTVTVGPRIHPDDFEQGHVFNWFAEVGDKRPATPME